MSENIEELMGENNNINLPPMIDEIYEDNNTGNKNKSESFSTIKKEDKNTNKDFLTEKVNITVKNENPSTYYCKNCNSFPEIKIKDKNSLIFICDCEVENNLEINYKIFFKFIVTHIESEDDLKKKLICPIHLKEFKCYNYESKKNLCEICYEEENQKNENILSSNNENYKYFNKKDKEINNIEELINKYFNYFPNEKQQNYFHNSNKTKSSNNQNQNSSNSRFIK